MNKQVTSIKKGGANNQLNFNDGLKDGLPIGLGYLSVSFAFGVSASLLGLPFFMSVLISMTNLTSAGQLAGLNVIVALGSVVEMVLTQLVINARYFLMSITLTQKLDGSFSFPHRLFCSAFVTDEIFAVASSKKSFNRKYFYGLVVLPYIGWAVGTLLGSLAGNILPEFVSNALGIALYAMFIAIILPPSMSSKGIFLTVAIASGISCLLYFLPIFSGVSTGISIIISALISALIMAFICPVKDQEQGGD